MDPARERGGGGSGRSGASGRSVRPSVCLSVGRSFSQPRHAGPPARPALLFGRQPPAAAAAMAVAKGALEEGEGGSAEAGAELGADGDGRAALSGAGGCDKPRFSPPSPTGAGEAVDGQAASVRPGDGSSPRSLLLTI